MAKGFGSKGGMKSFSKGGSSRSYASRSSFGGLRNRSSGSRFSFGSGGGSGRSWFSAPGSPGHTGGSGSRSIWDDTGPEVSREESGAPLDVAGHVDGVEEAVDAYRDRDWARFWRVVGFAVLAVVVILVLLGG